MYFNLVFDPCFQEFQPAHAHRCDDTPIGVGTIKEEENTRITVTEGCLEHA